ncbi:Protein of unknown function [Flavobacteriaceae bacterium MAR_2010_188]|nr:Protein of unknown function [Flavobacteriaceae bacterium MAR_2010_188]
MKKSKLITMFILLIVTFGYSQTEQELEVAKSAKKDSIAAIQKRVNAIQSEIDALPGWKVGAFGVIGGSVSGFNNWYAQGSPNNSTGNIGINFNGYANLKDPQYFWRNAMTANLKWQKFDDKDNELDDDSFNPTTDVFNISSLFGYKINENFAASALSEYRTTILDNFNDPGYLDIGVGGTWTPIENLVVVVHPLNYNFVFSKEDNIFESSLGAKIVADYTRQIGQVSFKSNLSAFQSYKSSDYSNWTWTNSFAWTLWKKFGVGADIGLRKNKQEALNYAINTQGDENATFDNVDNKLQSYYTVGISYAF